MTPKIDYINRSITTDDRFAVPLIAGMVYWHIVSSDRATNGHLRPKLRNMFLANGTVFLEDFICNNLTYDARESIQDTIDGFGHIYRLSLIEDMVRLMLGDEPINKHVDIANMTY